MSQGNNCENENADIVVASGPSPELIRAGEALKVHYTGTARSFPFLGRTFEVSKGFDVFNYYRRCFYNVANELAKALSQEFYARVHDLDSYVAYFPEMYLRYREPLVVNASNLLVQAGVYDVSIDMFRDEYNKEFHLCSDDMQVTIDSINLTIEQNQNNIVRGYNMMPGLIFSGFGGIIAATAVNVAVSSISEAQIRNANINASQRKTLYNRVNFQVLLEHAFVDYWRVFCLLTWYMNRKGCDVWYLSEEGNTKAKGMFENLCAN